MYTPPDRLHLGSAWYPEHWPEERWPEDVRLMREANFTVARLGEFAWSTLEPAPGDFQLDWLERAVTLLAENGLSTVMGTPTAAPPAWLTHADPDMLAVDETGRRAQHGARCHYCVTSPAFHAASKKIVAAMAARFGPNPAVIGWQFDNEYNRVCYCDRCRVQFQAWLREHFETLDALNAAWSTAYWSQTYTDWAQIPLPIGGHNPGLLLSHRRFVTDCYVKFQRIQLDALRPHLPEGVWTTHNFMGWFPLLDSYKLTADLDVASHDWYIGTGHHDHTINGAVHDLTRGFKRQNFWLMETQPGNVNWSTVNNALDAGEARLMAWHAVSHGADAILYWQWRSALGGQEQYHGTLVDQSGQPRPFYGEARWIGRNFKKIADLLAGAKRPARVAIIHDYDSRWSLDWQRHHVEFDYVQHLLSYYKPLAARSIPVDIVPPDAPFDGYKMIIIPALIMADEAFVTRLKEFARRGGHVLITARSGVKDAENALLPTRPPGPFAEMAGIEVEEYYALQEPVSVKGNWFSGEARVWAERVKATGKTNATAARFANAGVWLDEQPAVVVNAHGTGMVYYIAGWLDDASIDMVLERFMRTASIRPPLEAPAGVEATRLVNAAGEDVYIVINHTTAEQVIKLKFPTLEHLTGAENDEGPLTLGPIAVAVLTKVVRPEPPPPAEEAVVVVDEAIVEAPGEESPAEAARADSDHEDTK